MPLIRSSASSRQIALKSLFSIDKPGSSNPIKCAALFTIFFKTSLILFVLLIVSAIFLNDNSVEEENMKKVDNFLTAIFVIDLLLLTVTSITSIILYK